MIERLKKLPFFYGWILVGISFLNLAVGYGSRASFSVFLVFIQENYGWSRGDISAGFTVHMLVAMIGVPFVGAVVDRYGPRVLLPTGVAIMSLAIWMLGGMNRIWHFYFFYGLLMASGRIMISMAPHTAIISNWFVKKRGTAMGMTAAGSGSGSIMMTPLFQQSLTRLGWRTGCAFVAALIVAVLFPLNVIFQRLRPSDVGLLPDGDLSDEKSGETSSRVSQKSAVDLADNGWTTRQAVASLRFWLLYLIFLFSASVQMIQMHLVAFLQDVGLDINVAVGIFAVVGLVQSVGVFSGGALSDRIGREKSLTIGVCLQIIGILILMWIRRAVSWVNIPLFILIYGVGNGSRTSIMPTLTADLFPGNRVGSVYGLLATAITMSAAFGTWFAGWLHDLTGTYTLTFWIVIFFLLIVCILIWLIKPPKKTDIQSK